MKLHYLYSRTLSAGAIELIDFDVASIRQVAAGQRAAAPEIWIVDPDQYEKDGRILRDSPTYRLIAYSAGNRILYASDGCNACSRPVGDLRELQDFPPALIQRLASLIA
jgi:hypothetical protein